MKVESLVLEGHCARMDEAGHAGMNGIDGKTEMDVVASVEENLTGMTDCSCSWKSTGDMGV